MFCNRSVLLLVSIPAAGIWSRAPGPDPLQTRGIPRAARYAQGTWGALTRRVFEQKRHQRVSPDGPDGGAGTTGKPSVSC